jgi:hypothetical protein
MKKVLLARLAFAAGIILWSACATLKVTSDYDKAVNFQQYKTFRMVQLDQQHQTISQLNQQRIINGIRSEMSRKGFQESASPDLEVNAIIILKDKKSVTANTNYYGYGGYYRPYAWGGGMASGTTTYSVQEYKDGSLIIDIVDSKTQKLVWEGIGNKEIDKPLKDPDKEVPEIIASIMASFPPGAAKK